MKHVSEVLRIYYPAHQHSIHIEKFQGNNNVIIEPEK